MKVVSRFEANLLRILAFLLRRAPAEQARPLIDAGTPAPACLSRTLSDLSSRIAAEKDASAQQKLRQRQLAIQGLLNVGPPAATAQGLKDQLDALREPLAAQEQELSRTRRVRRSPCASPSR